LTAFKVEEFWGIVLLLDAVVLQNLFPSASVVLQTPFSLTTAEFLGDKDESTRKPETDAVKAARAIELDAIFLNADIVKILSDRFYESYINFA
jgi:hypothetical protein